MMHQLFRRLRSLRMFAADPILDRRLHQRKPRIEQLDVRIAPAVVSPGDTLQVWRTATEAKVSRIDASGHDESIFTFDGNFPNPAAVTSAPDGSVYIAGWKALAAPNGSGTYSQTRIYRIDPRTGAQSTVATTDHKTAQLAVLDNNRLVDQWTNTDLNQSKNGGPALGGAVSIVTVATGAEQDLVSLPTYMNGVGEPTFSWDPGGVAVAQDGQVYFAANRPLVPVAHPTNEMRIYKLNVDTKAATIFTTKNHIVDDIAITNDNHLIYGWNDPVFTGAVNTGLLGGVTDLNLLTTVEQSVYQTSQLPPGSTPVAGVANSQSGAIYFATDMKQGPDTTFVGPEILFRYSKDPVNVTPRTDTIKITNGRAPIDTASDARAATVINIVTPGWNSDANLTPSGYDPAAPEWLNGEVALARTLGEFFEDMPGLSTMGYLPGSMLDNSVTSYVTEWDSASSFTQAYAALAGAKGAAVAAKSDAAHATALGMLSKFLLQATASYTKTSETLAHKQARELADDIIRSYLFGSITQSNSVQRIQFIGNGRGAGVNAEASRLIANAGYGNIDHFISLDGLGTDWADNVGVLGDYNLGNTAGSRKVNYRIDPGLTVLPLDRFYQYVTNNASVLMPTTTRNVLEAEFDEVRAPTRASWDNSSVVRPGDSTPPGQQTTNLNIFERYATSQTQPPKNGTVPSYQIVYDNYLGWNRFVGLPPGSGNADQKGMYYLEDLNPSPAGLTQITNGTGFAGSSFEHLGRLHAAVAPTIFDSVGDAFLDGWVSLLRNSHRILELLWETEGQVDLKLDAGGSGNHVELVQNINVEPSLSQIVQLPTGASTVSFKLTVDAAGANDKIQVFENGKMVGEVALAAGTSSTRMVALTSPGGSWADITFRVVGPTTVPAVVQLDDIFIIGQKNWSPVAYDLAYETGPAQPKTVPWSEVLQSASDVDGDTLTATVASQPAHGKLTTTATSFTYTPTAGYAGMDQFGYQVSDGKGGSTTAMIKFTTIGGVATGMVINDLDNDGVIDVGEPGLAGVSVFLDLNSDTKLQSGVEPETKTDANGNYSLTAFSDGTYNVRLNLTPPQEAKNGSSRTVTLTGGETKTVPAPKFAVHILTSTINGTVAIDSNRNGIRDGFELPLAGVQVFLDSNSNGKLDTGEPGKVSDANGKFEFTTSLTGNLPVRMVLPANYLASSTNPVPVDLIGGTVTVDFLVKGLGTIAAGAGAFGDPFVVVYPANSTTPRFGFYAYAKSFHGGVRVATADFNLDGFDDIVTAPAKTGGPDIRVYDGVTGLLLANFFAYAATMTAGVQIATGDVTGDGRPDIITGTGNGVESRVRVFSGVNLSGGPVLDFVPYAGFNVGSYVAAGDFNKDGKADIVTGPEVGNPHIKIFDGANPANALVAQFFAYNPIFPVGSSVAVNDFNNDGVPDVTTGAGAPGGPHIKIFSGVDWSLLKEFYDYPDSLGFKGGVRVAMQDVDGDGQGNVIAAPGPTTAAADAATRRIRIFNGLGSIIRELDPFPGFNGGIYVGAGAYYRPSLAVGRPSMDDGFGPEM